MNELPCGFASNVLKLTTGAFFVQGLGFVVAPVVTRLFEPEAYGVSALFLSITTIIGVVACLRYELSIMLPASNEEAANLLVLSIFSVFMISGVSGCVIFLTNTYIVQILKAPSLGRYLWLIPIAVFISGTSSALNYWNSRAKRFGRVSLAQVISSLVAQCTKLGAGFSGYVSSGVLIGSGLVGSFVSMLLLGDKVWRDDGGLMKSAVHWREISGGFKRYKKFPLVDIWGGLMNSVSWQLPIFMLSSFFSPTIVGFYALGSIVIGLPMNIIGGAIAQVFFQSACEAKTKGEINMVMGIVYRRLVAVGLFPILLLCLVGQDLFSVVFGIKWAEAGTYAQILAPWIFFTFISSPLSTLFFVLERQGSALVVHSLIFVTRLVSLYIGGTLGNVYIALILLSATGAVVYGALVIWNMRLATIPLSSAFTIFARYFSYFLPIGMLIMSLKLWFELSSIIYLSIGILTILGYELLVLYRNKSLKSHMKVDLI
jgi:lipopolysaccharide exporter